MDEVRRTKKALRTVGGVIVINLLLSLLIPSVILSFSTDMIGAFCLLGSITALLTALHPLLVIFAGVSILQARSEIRSTRITGIIAAVLLFLSMLIIPFTIGYGVLLSPLILFAAMGAYLHNLLDTKQRFLLYTGMGLLLLFYLGAFLIFLISDMAGDTTIRAAVLTVSILPLSTCVLYLISLHHSFRGLATPTPIGLESPSGEPRQEKMLMPPPGWMGGQPMCHPGRKPQKPQGWNLS